jgi:isoquinoline 1-oxidoreductase subunit beta
MSIRDRLPNAPTISRRNLLIGAGAGVGLVVAWTLWPRDYPQNLVAADGEHIINGFVKIGEDGHVIIVAPQAELGQGAYTLVAQMVADELGADWRTIGIEPAPLNQIYANKLAAEENATGLLTRLFGDAARWAAREASGRAGLQWTGGSTTVRAFEASCRHAGAAARTLLCMAAAKRWDADWRACDTYGGFVIRGDDRLRFGTLVADAAALKLPDTIPLREGKDNRLTGRSLPRLDLPAKVDGSVNYAADIRLPEMLFAAVRMGPLGDTRFKSCDKKAAFAVRGVTHVITHDRWVAVAATSWWIANQALDAADARFTTAGSLPSTASAHQALTRALDEEGARMYEIGDASVAVAGAKLVQADYMVGFAPHAAIEPMAATAMIKGDTLELWLPTQAPGFAAQAAAQAIGFAERDVIVHPMMVGGSFGRKYEVDIARQAAILARETERPVQVIWSRIEDMAQDRFRPAAAARMAARLLPAGRIETWQAKIAAPHAVAQMKARVIGGKLPHEAMDAGGSSDPTTVSGAVLPYSVSSYALDHIATDVGVPTGKWRSGADSYTAFFNECFIDELAQESGVEPFSFRMAILGANTRVAMCLSRATTIGDWQGGAQGSNQGIACHTMQGSHIAVLVEARIDDAQRIVVDRLIAVADVGRTVNPDIARQQIEGGLIFGLAAATGNSVSINKGIVSPLRLGGLGLPMLTHVKEVIVELIPSQAAPGGVGEIGVPAIAPAIANALHAASGRRFRSLPLLPANRA